MSSKGKGKAEAVVSGNRKSSAGRCLGGTEESRRKWKNTGVLQFFEDAAEVDDNDASDDSDIDNYMTDRSSFFSCLGLFASFLGIAFYRVSLFLRVFLGFCLFLGF